MFILRTLFPTLSTNTKQSITSGLVQEGTGILIPLCCLWLDNLDKLPPLRKAEVDGDEPEEEEDENEDSDTGMMAILPNQ